MEKQSAAPQKTKRTNHLNLMAFLRSWVEVGAEISFFMRLISLLMDAWNSHERHIHPVW
jgi:hypothetical protein